MKILLCVKQVPDTEHNAPNYGAEDNRVKRTEAPAVINVFDSYAVEAASRVKDVDADCLIVSLTMGPQQARSVLKETLSISADRAYQLCDDGFAGLDGPATARVLAAAIRKIEESEGRFDAVFCGKLSADGETSIVPAGIAQTLGCSMVSGCIEALPGGDKLALKKAVKGGVQMVEAATPCVVSFDKPEGEFKFPTIKRKLAANRAEIPVLSAEDIQADTSSATTVLKVYSPERNAACVLFKGETAEESAAQLFGKLSAEKII